MMFIGRNSYIKRLCEFQRTTGSGLGTIICSRSAHSGSIPQLQKYALCCPGQGVQTPLMAVSFLKEFPKTVKPILEEMDESLQEYLSKYLIGGNVVLEDINNTSIAQPAILTMGYIISEVLRRDFGVDLLQNQSAKYIVGHSLGEFTSLTIAKNLSFKDAVWLVRQRGKFMEESTKEYYDRTKMETGMKAIVLRTQISSESSFDTFLKLLRQKCQEISKKTDQVVCIGNVNSRNQVVLSGVNDLMNLVVKDVATELNWKRAPKLIRLNVSGPFHSTVMKSARDSLARILEDGDRIKVNWNHTNVRIISNLEAKPFTSKKELVTSMAETTINPVNWLGCIEYIEKDPEVNHYIALGPGNVSKNLIKNIISIEDVVMDLSKIEDFESIAKALSH